MLKADGETLTSGAVEKAERLSSYFSSVFNRDRNEDDTGAQKFTQHKVTSCFASPQSVRKKLESLKTAKSPGPDQVHPRVLKELAEVLSEPISIILNMSFESATLPDNWKTAHISAIHKKGSKHLPENYRPVSLTSVVAKLAESFIRETIMVHMRDNKLFSKKQFGFLGGRSTVLQLLVVLDQWTQILDAGGFVDILYFDFMKAFDKVPHIGLLKTVERYGISGLLYDWIRAFLLDRKQRVCIQGSFSGWTNVESGIPQGSVLGPLLFIIFINELPSKASNAEIFLFADDMKVYNGIGSESDCENLQKDVDSVCSWAAQSTLKFHPEKCKHLRLSLRDHPEHCYTLGDTGSIINQTDQEKDIGVIFDTKLTFNGHIAAKINKANSILGIISRTFEYKSQDILILLYKALVRPHLEFANQVWSPYLKKHISAIENVQRRLTRMVPGMKDLSYQERLIKLKLPSLAYRRLRGDAIEAFKIIRGYYDNEVTSGLFRFVEDSVTRGHKYKLFKSRSRLDLRKNSFFLRVVDVWNSLPESVVEAPSIQSFERRLDKFWQNKDIRYDYTAAWYCVTRPAKASVTATEELALEA